jgi:adenylate cyclase
MSRVELDPDSPSWARERWKNMCGGVARRRDRISAARQRWVAAIALSLAIFIIFQIITEQGFLQSFELTTYDHWLQLRPRDRNAVTPILIVGIDDDDIKKQLDQSQISDARLALLIQSLEKMGARAIGIDLVRDTDVAERHPETLPKDRPNFGDIASDDRNDPKYANIVFVMKLPGVNTSTSRGPQFAFNPPIGMLPDSERAGQGDILEDPDGIVRRGLIYESAKIKGENQNSSTIQVLSFAMRIALVALNVDGISLQPGTDASGAFLQLGHALLRPLGHNEPLYTDRDAGGFQVFMDYRQADDIDGIKPIKIVNYRNVIATDFDPDDVKDKIVLIGGVSEVQKDFFSSPLQRDDFGVNLHARLINQILRYSAFGVQTLHGINGFEEGSWLLLWCLLGGVLGNQLLSPLKFGAVLALGLTGVPLLSFLIFLRQIWVPAVGPAMAFFTATAFVTATVAYMEHDTNVLLKRLASIIGGKLSRADTDEVLRTGRILPREVNVTVLFTDLKDFSEICKEFGDPKPVMEWLNTYMDSMTNVINRRRGYVNKYMGDAIMAIFGAPLPSTDPAPKDPTERARCDARNAVRCALDMRRALRAVNKEYEECDPPQPLARMRIGIYSGAATSGSLGSKERLEYTVTGDIVNAAARLESFRKSDFDAEKRYCADDCRILIGGSTFELVGAEFETIDLGIDFVKGCGEISIYGVCKARSASAASEPVAALEATGQEATG